MGAGQDCWGRGGHPACACCAAGLGSGLTLFLTQSCCPRCCQGGCRVGGHRGLGHCCCPPGLRCFRNQNVSVRGQGQGAERQAGWPGGGEITSDCGSKPGAAVLSAPRSRKSPGTFPMPAVEPGPGSAPRRTHGKRDWPRGTGCVTACSPPPHSWLSPWGDVPI